MLGSRMVTKACLGAGAILLTICAALSLQAAEDAAAYKGANVVARRLTPDQYRHIIADVFGPTVKINGRIEPEPRVNGLLAVGSSRISVSATGFESYDAMARDIARQVVDETRRNTLLPCTPASARQFDESCAATALGDIARFLFRRPVTAQELRPVLQQVAASTETSRDFHTGLATGISILLVSPEFLFRVEYPEKPGSGQISGYSKASRLSFLMWDTAPDNELLRAAGAGELDTPEGLSRQIDRLLASPRLEDGIRGFFNDMLQLDEFSNVSKDSVLYPKFFNQVRADAREQTLKTIVDHLLTRKGDYRDLFTTRRTFLSPLLGSIYHVPVPRSSYNTAPDQWMAYEFPEGDKHVGLLTQPGFVALHSHPGRTSPTLRGKALREILFCQKVPDPPNNVDFAVAQDTSNPVYKTARARLKAHATEAMCTGCHKITDPMGLALENFDTTGSYRTSENGEAIDTTGELDGKQFADVRSLATLVHDAPQLTSCLVNRVYSYATGLPVSTAETALVKRFAQEFADAKYQMPALLKRIATSDAFYTVSTAPSGSKAAMNSSQENAK